MKKGSKKSKKEKSKKEDRSKLITELLTEEEQSECLETFLALSAALMEADMMHKDLRVWFHVSKDDPENAVISFEPLDRKTVNKKSTVTFTNPGKMERTTKGSK